MRRCCSQRVSSRHSMHYGASGSSCDLTAQLQMLSDALEQANALGLYNESEIVLAQSVYNTYSGTTAASAIMVAQTDCDKASTDIGSALGVVQGLIIAVNGSLPTTPSPGTIAGISMATIGLGLVGVWAAWWAVTK